MARFPIGRNQSGKFQFQRLRLTSPDKATFLVLPMIHVADKAFYQEVSAHVETCDAVLSEGVRSRKLSTAIKRVHSLASGGGHGLNLQSREVKHHARTFYSDIDAEEFETLWKGVPRWRKVFFWSGKSLVFLLMRSRRFRRWLLKENKEGLGGGEMLEKLFGKDASGVLVDRRNAILMSHCDTMVEGWAGHVVGIVWGAAHIPDLIAHLEKAHGYTIQHEAWMTAISVED